MSLIRMLMILPASLLLLGSIPSLAQSDPGMEDSIPGADSLPVEAAPIESDSSVETEITPNSTTETDIPQNVGGTSSDGPLSLVQCGPSGASFLVTKIPVGCHILGVNSPPGQSENAETTP